MLCARPGNVGVQIDSYRTMKSMFNRPRCGQFTAHFLGYTFENSSIDNYQRVVERTAQRAKILEAKLAKLREHEQHLLDDEAKRKTRRQEREAARQRRLWEQLQSMKRQNQRAKEADAALVIQRHTRGMVARRFVAAMKRQRAEQHAGDVLQRTLTRYASHCRRHRQMASAKREAVATALQRRARSFVRERRTDRESGSSSSPPANDAPDEEVLSVLAAVVDRVASKVETPMTNTPHPELVPSLIARDISLELLFSDDEGGDEDSPAVAIALTPLLTPFAPRPPPPTTGQPTPKRPARVKRVGGGFRPSAGASSPSSVRRRQHHNSLR